jgi:hypothetical protein
LFFLWKSYFCSYLCPGNPQKTAPDERFLHDSPPRRGENLAAARQTPTDAAAESKGSRQAGIFLGAWHRV